MQANEYHPPMNSQEQFRWKDAEFVTPEARIKYLQELMAEHVRIIQTIPPRVDFAEGVAAQSVGVASGGNGRFCTLDHVTEIHRLQEEARDRNHTLNALKRRVGEQAGHIVGYEEHEKEILQQLATQGEQLEAADGEVLELRAQVAALTAAVNTYERIFREDSEKTMPSWIITYMSEQLNEVFTGFVQKLGPVLEAHRKAMKAMEGK